MTFSFCAAILQGSCSDALLSLAAQQLSVHDLPRGATYDLSWWFLVGCSFGRVASHYHQPTLPCSQKRRYDHHQFPGVVPRSFLGPAVVAAAASPAVAAQSAVFTAMDPEWADDAEATRLYAQRAVRLALAALVALAFRDFQLAAAPVFGSTEATLLGVVSAVQFHLPFYMSRPLPNTFALALVLMGLAGWLRGNHDALIRWMVPAVVIFRAELVVLLGPVMLAELTAGRITFGTMLTKGVVAGVASLAATVAFDSVFWGRPLYPEGEVLYFNTVLNKSKEWGVMPFWWYFYSAIPKAMTGTLALCLAGAALDSRVCRATNRLQTAEMSGVERAHLVRCFSLIPWAPYILVPITTQANVFIFMFCDVYCACAVFFLQCHANSTPRLCCTPTPTLPDAC
jgi:alpha-1,6-mannosyltransferase